MKQITIYDLLPLLKSGWVAMNYDGTWCWHKGEPTVGVNQNERWINYSDKLPQQLSVMFNIKPFNGDWKDSLMECGR